MDVSQLNDFDFCDFPDLLAAFDTVEHPQQAMEHKELGKRKRKTVSKTEEQWEACRTIFHNLYIVQNLPLAQVMIEMERNHGFSAS